MFAYRYTQDYALWCSLAGISSLYNLSDELVLHRFHEKSVSKMYSGEQHRNAVDIIRQYFSSAIGEDVPAEHVMRILENRQGEDDRVPEDIYKLYKKAISGWSMTTGDEKFIRKDAAKKILYRYDLLKNSDRRRTIGYSFEASALYCAIMIGI